MDIYTQGECHETNILSKEVQNFTRVWERGGGKRGGVNSKGKTKQKVR